MIGKAPSQFTITPRNTEREIIIGGDYMLFGNVSSPPNYWDMEVGKTVGTREQCANLLKLTQYLTAFISPEVIRLNLSIFMPLFGIWTLSTTR